MDRDASDHVRFCPLQSKLGQQLCKDHGAPVDVKTAVLIDEEGVHTHSAAILRLFPSMGFPFTMLGPIGLCVPRCLRDAGYIVFARNRGAIWRAVKRCTGWGDTSLKDYRDRVVGLEEPLPPSWGFGEAEKQ